MLHHFPKPALSPWLGPATMNLLDRRRRHIRVQRSEHVHTQRVYTLDTWRFRAAQQFAEFDDLAMQTTPISGAQPAQQQKDLRDVDNDATTQEDANQCLTLLAST